MEKNKPTFIEISLVTKDNSTLDITLNLSNEIRMISIDGITESLIYVNENKYKDTFFRTKRFEYFEISFLQPANKRMKEYGCKLFNLFKKAKGIEAISFLDLNMKEIEKLASWGVPIGDDENKLYSAGISSLLGDFAVSMRKDKFE